MVDFEMLRQQFEIGKEYRLTRHRHTGRIYVCAKILSRSIIFTCDKRPDKRYSFKIKDIENKFTKIT